ncbi:MAG TPA: hypothetical protein PLL53_19095, partial [Saprospiraceae bacterium]|nr:hypothetical protein [Saprospiraceae bacterium]
LLVEKLDFPFGEISKSPIEIKALFYFGKSNSWLEPRLWRGRSFLQGDYIVTFYSIGYTNAKRSDFNQRMPLE